MRKHIGAATAALVTAGLVTAAPAGHAAVPFGPRPVVLATSVAGPVIGTELVALGDRMIFPAEDPVHGTELWVSDGTPTGTRLLKNLVPDDGGVAGSDPRRLVVFKNRVFFAADDAAGDTELYVTDGTAAGTKLFKALDAGRPIGLDSDPQELTVAGGRLYFHASTVVGGASGGEEPWVSDGTVSGTRLLKDIAVGSGGSEPSEFTAFGNRVAFVAYGDNEDLYVTDGTTAGTQLLHSGWDESGPSELTALGTRLLMVGTRSSSVGRELWVTDGVQPTPTLVKDIYPADGGNSGPEDLTAFAGRVWFSAYEPSTGTELYRSDGTTAGTVRVGDVAPGSTSSSPRFLTPWGTALYYVAGDGVDVNALFRVGATGAPTKVLATDPGGDSGISWPRAVGPRLVFAASTPATSHEWWTSDGTTAGSAQLVEHNPDGQGAQPGYVVRAAHSTAVLVGVRNGIETVYAYTTRPSSTVVRPKASYTARQARLKRIVVPVVVRGASGLTGTVTLRAGTTVLGRAKVVDGKASVRIGKRLVVGKHRVRATYSGSLRARTSTSPVAVVKVVR